MYDYRQRSGGVRIIVNTNNGKGTDFFISKDDAEKLQVVLTKVVGKIKPHGPHGWWGLKQIR